MKRVLVGIGILLGVAVFVVVGHLAFIEVGRDVVTLRTPRPDGSWQETRLWIVEDGATPWLHSAGADWAKRFAGDPIVEIDRDGVATRYRAHPTPGPHPRIHELLREKYGIADRWVRFIGPDGPDVLPIRLDPL